MDSVLFGDQILFFVMADAKVMLCAFVKLEALEVCADTDVIVFVV